MPIWKGQKTVKIEGYVWNFHSNVAKFAVVIVIPTPRHFLHGLVTNNATAERVKHIIIQWMNLNLYPPYFWI